MLALFCHKLEPSIIFSFNARINYKMTTKYAFINFLFSGALILAVFKTILLTFPFKLTFIICKTYLFVLFIKIVSRETLFKWL